MVVRYRRRRVEDGVSARERVAILAIDGGGIRGVVPAMVLAEIEERTGRRVSELFDLVAGTSTGGILGLGLAVAGENGGPRWRAADMVGLYEAEGPRIFSESVLHEIASVGGVLEERYPAGPLEDALKRYLGDAPLSAALVDVLVPAYEIERRIPFFFKSSRARSDPDYDFPMWQVARATAAAPTYFPPERIDVEPPADYFALVDGGTFANNPAMCAYAESRRDGADPDIVLVSLGTGDLRRPIPLADAEGWGILGWARPLLQIVFDGVSLTIDFQLEQLLGPGRYHRLQTPLDQASDDLDDASPENIHALKLTAERLIAERSDEIDAICAALAG